MPQVIAGNWKMNLRLDASVALARAVAGGASGCPDATLVLCPPATAIAAVASVLAGSAVATGGQNCHEQPAGAFTGDIAAGQLTDAGASWVILGHSERRAHHGETDAQVRAKVLAAQAAGLRAIVCVGESEAQRRDGHEVAVVGGQIAGSLPPGFSGVVAYEPIWAIGTGRVPTNGQITAMHAAIRARLLDILGGAGGEVAILYGGSVKAANAAELLALPEVGGALVGGASLDAAEFLAIAAAALPNPGAGG